MSYRVQAEPRFKKRVPCAVRIGGRRHSGIVLNVSRGGLYVQSSATASPGASVNVELTPSDRDAIELEATVVWKRVVPTRLRGVAHGGVGLRIERASEAWYRFFVGVASPGEKPAAAARPARRFRVCLGRPGSPRMRTLVVSAPDAGAASREALAQSGPGWRVREVVPD
jgi:hypothetical protein